MRTRALAIVAVLAVAFAIGRRAVAGGTPAAPLPCPEVATLVTPPGESLACLNSPVFSGCSGLESGERYRDCAVVGPMRGAVLRLRHLPIDVNRGSANDLRALDGVGAKTAAAIVEARAKAPFCSPSDLERVRGLGPSKVKALTAKARFTPTLCGDSARE